MKTLLKSGLILSQLFLATSFAQETQTVDETAVVVDTQATEIKPEPAYIGDRIFLGLYAEQNATGSAILTMRSGSKVDVLQRDGKYVKLRTADGTEGWARASFVSTNKPTSLLLKEVQKERDGLAKQLRTLKKGETATNDLQTKLAEAQKTIETLENELSLLKQTPSTETTTEAVKENSSIPNIGMNILNILYFVVALLAVMALGFLFGKMWMGKKVRKQFSGYRIW